MTNAITSPSMPLAANPNLAGSGTAIPAVADGDGDGSGEGEAEGLDAAAVGAATEAAALANAVGAADGSALAGATTEGTTAMGEAPPVPPVGPGLGPPGDVYAASPTPASSATRPSVVAATSTRARGGRIRPAPLPAQPGAPAGDRAEEKQCPEERQRGGRLVR